MKKINLSLILITCTALSAFSQWVGTNPVYFNAGNVGIGTTTPGRKLDVIGRMRFRSDISNTAGFWLTDNAGTESAFFGLTDNTSNGSVGVFHSGQWHLIVSNTGNVGIGTQNTGTFKLAVEGKIGAREVNVTTTTPWPDYVFNSDYKLSSLAEVKDYIKKNKHLPEVPSAEDVKVNGVNLGEMNSILLKKIEELTLHLILLKEQNEELKTQVELIKTKIDDK